ncbi:hypothetical protein C1J01_47985, partial [Nonomuraea aridisoli]
MRFSILGALLGTVALAGTGGAAITQASATESLRLTGNPPPLQLALAADPTTPDSPTASPSPTETLTPTETPTPTASPTNADYTAETRVVKRRGISYLNVSVAYEGAGFFSVDQRVCRRGACTTANTEITVINGEGDATARLGRGTFKKRGQPEVAMAPLPTVTVRETVTITEPGPTVTVTEPAPTVTVTEPAPTVTVTEPAPTVTVTCRPDVAPTPTETLPPTVEPTDPAEPTDSPTAEPTGTETTAPAVPAPPAAAAPPTETPT